MPLSLSAERQVLDVHPEQAPSRAWPGRTDAVRIDSVNSLPVRFRRDLRVDLVLHQPGSVLDSAEIVLERLEALGQK